MPGMQDDINGQLVMALRISSRVQNLAVGAASVSSTVFLARMGSIGASAGEQDAGLGAPGIVPGPVGTSHVRLVSTVDCFVSIGPTPTASATTSSFLPASSVEYFPVTQGDQVAVIQSTTGGSLNITEC